MYQFVSLARDTHTQDFDYDAVGNFDSVTTDGSTQTRSVNRQNQITSISGATTPTYDDNGNMTGDETGRQFVYDAWNRLVIVKNSSGTTLETFKYDGLNRRVSSSDGTTTTDLYYSSDWQVLSEKVGSNTTKRYVWSPVYVDAMVLRDRDTDGNGTLDERLWVQQDANWNITALVNGSGGVVERYAYDPYGAVTVYDASWSSVGSSAYDFVHGFQGLRYDPTEGLNFTHTRPYSSSLGRFTGPDWIRFDGGDVNFYRTEVNNPGNNLDPKGAQPVYGGYRPSAPEPEPPRMPPPKNPFITITISDITLHVIDDTTKKELKVINVGKGNSIRKDPGGSGSDLTMFEDEDAIVIAKARIHIENHGKCDLQFSSTIYFGADYGKLGFIPDHPFEDSVVTVRPGKQANPRVSFSDTIHEFGTPKDGKYRSITFLTVIVTDFSKGSDLIPTIGFVTTAEGWYVREKDAKE